MSFWPVLCIAVVAIEGFIGFAINVLALIYLFDGRLQTKATYKLSLVVSTMQFIGLSAISGFATMCHLFHNQIMFLVYFGLLPILPQIASDVALVTLVLLVFGIWEMAPAPCILQYLALCKPHFSTPKRLLMAYSVCIVLHYCSLFFTDVEYRAECAEIGRHVFNVSDDEGVEVHCASLRFEDKHSVMPIALFGVLPSYTIGYFIFGICCFKIYRALNVYKMDTKSLKTQQLQKRFFKTLLLQGLLPLLVLSLPVGVFFAGVFGPCQQYKFVRFSFHSKPSILIIFTTIQGLVSLSFLRKLKPPSTVQSLSSRNTDSRAH
ncbi:hypothetical protein PRIPAC_96241 [Pristionchus pacificus]|uniref:G protein-coupled receptor n=1 Tax=Pristionchus pacificus TaxID=54126 RepID=A0A2A6D2S1_PRIPA|nr:hypothetical protein PRIPAC_96241 [Pristionchus pacificus]|eukprot:PDM84607.1 G protein-coupled receptor [Pristionchus pacificus]